MFKAKLTPATLAGTTAPVGDAIADTIPSEREFLRLPAPGVSGGLKMG